MSFAVDDIVRLHCLVNKQRVRLYARILEVLDAKECPFQYTVNPPFELNNNGFFLGDVSYITDKGYMCRVLRWKAFPVMEGATSLWDFKCFEKVEKVSGNELRNLLQDLIVEGL